MPLAVIARAVGALAPTFEAKRRRENVWITGYFGKTVTKLRAADGVKLGTFNVGDGATGVVFDGTNIWVVNNGDSMLMKVSGGVLATYATGKSPFAVAFDGAKVWVSNFASNSVSSTAAN